MSSCASIDPLVTPYVDGELVGVERERLERHIGHCQPCSARVSAERAVAALCRERRVALRLQAPATLRARCVETAAAGRDHRTSRIAMWRSMVPPLVAAATILFGVAWYASASSTDVIATELALDHVKCRLMNAVLGTRHSEAQVRSTVQDRFGWNVQLPERPEQLGLDLVGSRPCLYDHGTIAHIMYRHQGVLASLYMLPGRTQRDAAVRALGHEAVFWSNGDRTFVVVERMERAEVARVATFVRASLR